MALFNLVYGRRHDMFPFHIIDYDTKRGYDALVTQRDPRDLTRGTVYFVEFKHTLEENFNHAFEHLNAVVCWECNMADGSTVRDITDTTRELHITPPQNANDYTHFMLVTTTGRHNIEVYVLKYYLREKLNIEFAPRPPRTPLA